MIKIRKYAVGNVMTVGSQKTAKIAVTCDTIFRAKYLHCLSKGIDHFDLRDFKVAGQSVFCGILPASNYKDPGEWPSWIKTDDQAELYMSRWRVEVPTAQKGQQIALTVRNRSNRSYKFAFTLSGSSAEYD